jgi:hypothetical protein
VKVSVMGILTTVGILVMLLVLPALKYGTRVIGRRPDDWLTDPGRPRPSRRQWALLAVGVAAVGVFWNLMQIDQLHGGNQVWPIYAFVGAIFFLEIVWYTLMTRLWP